MKLPNSCGCQFPLDKGNIFHLENRTTDYDSRRTWDSGLDAGSTPARSMIKDKIGSQAVMQGCFLSVFSRIKLSWCKE